MEPRQEPEYCSQSLSQLSLIDWLRGLASLWVFLFHFTGSRKRSEIGILESILQNGNLGVCMFFVISGYCISIAGSRVVDGKESAFQFLFRRFVRIYPSYWASIVFAILIVLVWEWIGGLKTGIFEIGKSSSKGIGWASFTVTQWIATFSLTQGLERLPVEALWEKFKSINPVYWTLSIEVQFYAVYAAALALGKVRSHVLFLVTFASCLWVAYGVPDTYGLFFPYWPQFLFGILLRKSLPYAFWCFETRGSVAMIGAGVGSFAAMTLSSTYQVLFAGAFACFIWSFAPLCQAMVSNAQGGGSLKGMVFATFDFFGSISYSLYLVHVPLLFKAKDIIARLPWLNESVGSVIAFFTILLGAWCFYRVAERPVVQVLKRMRLKGSNREHIAT